MFVPPLKNEELIDRIKWLINLRWMAAAGVFVAVFLAINFLGFELPAIPLYGIALLIFSYNVAFLVFERMLEVPAAGVDVGERANAFANLQISFDLISLTMLLHFSGGIENPFVFYFIFHMIIASIMLSMTASFFQATFAATLFTSLVIFEYLGVVQHYCIDKFSGIDLHQNNVFIAGTLFVFVTTLYLSVYMATSISSRLRTRTKELDEANKKLLEQDMMKSEYVQRVTHDITGHIAAIQGSLLVASDQAESGNFDKAKYLISRTEARAGTLIHFVKDLLALSKIKAARQLHMEPIPIDALIEETIEDLYIQPKDKNIDFSVDVFPKHSLITADRTNIKHLFNNLIANAIKYTPEGGKVSVKISQDKSQVVIEVSDTGIGISPEDLEKVFDEFFRAKNAKQMMRDGTGMGLSLARHIVDMHGGSIKVESKLGEGTKFLVTLPKSLNNQRK
jgi:signal transduction histidine kinase